jgi:sporulation protein YlmC with PRC-barrel domain
MRNSIIAAAVTIALAPGLGVAQQLGEPRPEGQAADPAPLGQAPAGRTPDAAPPAPLPPETLIKEQSADQVLSDSLIGMTVYNRDSESIGKIGDLIMNSEGQIIGAVVSVGGFLGLGAKSVALDWNAFEVRPEEEAAYVEFTESQLRAAPEFKDLFDVEFERRSRESQGAPVTQ